MFPRLQHAEVAFLSQLATSAIPLPPKNGATKVAIPANHREFCLDKS